MELTPHFELAIRMRTLRLHLFFTRRYVNVCRAGSLAVILQPAFVPFVVQWSICSGALLLVAQLPVLFENLPVDFAADVEHGIGCVWFEFAANVFGLNLVLKLLQCLALLFCEQVAVLGK